MLFKTSDKVKEYAQLTGSVNLESIKATMNFVEDKHIQSILGKELYTSLREEHLVSTDDVTLASPELTELLEQCRKVIGPMLCYYYAPKADVVVSDSGVQRVETQSNKTAYQYQNTNYAQANLAEGETCTELLLAYLEDNKDSFPQWMDSSSFVQYRSLFIKTGKEFDELYTSSTPYRNYWAMRSKMIDVEENNIRDLLGDELFDALKEKDAAVNVDFTEAEEKLLKKIKKAIAYYTVAFAIPMLNVRIDSNGLSVIAFSSFSDNAKENTRSGADDNARSLLIKACFDSGETWIENTIRFLKSDKTTFPTWIGFAEVPLPERDCINDELTGSFGLM